MYTVADVYITTVFACTFQGRIPEILGLGHPEIPEILGLGHPEIPEILGLGHPGIPEILETVLGCP